MNWRYPILILCVGYLFVGLVGCKKSDPEPEKKDSLYLQFLDEEKSAQSEFDSAKVALAEAKGELSKVVPQTGQNKYAEKRFWDAKTRISKAEQRMRYLSTRAKLQMWKTRVDSLTAFHKDKEWSNPGELEAYNTQKGLDTRPRNWSVKDRRAALGLPTGRNIDSVTPAPAAAAHGAEKPAEADQH